MSFSFVLLSSLRHSLILIGFSNPCDYPVEICIYLLPCSSSLPPVFTFFLYSFLYSLYLTIVIFVFFHLFAQFLPFVFLLLLSLFLCACFSRISDPFHCHCPSQIGSRRCHDPQEEKCVDSQLGSGPGTGNSGTGYYTVDQYKEILRYHFLSISVCYTGLVPVPLLGMF